MKERFCEVTSEADENQEDRFETWLAGEEIPFVSPEAEADYKARVTLLKDAIQLKKAPQRTPICPSAGFFTIQYAGFSMYDAIDVIKNAGLHDQVKIMVGGGAVDEKVRANADVDAYGPDAVAAVNLSREWVAIKPFE